MMAIEERPDGRRAGSTGQGGRLLSLDILRGLTVAGMILVNAAAGVHYSAEATVWPTLLHVPWDGLTLADFVFPSFLMMVGVSIPLAAIGRPPATAGRVLARAAKLVLLGVVLSNLYWAASFDGSSFRPFGVLQRIGLAYAGAALLVLVAGPRVRIAIAAAILVLYWPLTALPPLDGGVADLWMRGQNFVSSVDRLLLGPFAYYTTPDGYDPEGLLGTLPAIAHVLIGVALGERLAAAGDRRRAARDVALAGAAMLALGLVWSLGFPIVKDLWSSSFVLVTCGATALALALLVRLVDDPAHPRLPWLAALALPFGANAIAAYVLHMVTANMPAWSLLLVPYHATRAAIGDPTAALLPVLLYMAFLWWCVAALRRRGWFVKI